MSLAVLGTSITPFSFTVVFNDGSLLSFHRLVLEDGSWYWELSDEIDNP